MALVYKKANYLTCLSTDTKPTTLPTNFISYETDTNLRFIWNGTSWRMIDPFVCDIKRYGAHALDSSTAEGFLGSTNSGSITTSVDTTLKRKYQRFATTAASGTTAGYRAAATIHNRSMNTKMYVEFRLNTTANQRLYIGFDSTTTAETGDDPLNATSGWYFGFISTDTLFKILSNDGTGATVSTAVTAVTTIDTTMHKLWIVADDANSQFGISIDGNAYQYISTAASIPAATTALGFRIEIQNSVATDKQIDIFNWVLLTDNG
jgi:hypothetical protein